MGIRLLRHSIAYQYLGTLGTVLGTRCVVGEETATDAKELIAAGVAFSKLIQVQRKHG